MQVSSNQIKNFLNNGWAIFDLPEPEIIYRFAQALEHKAQEITKNDCKLSNLHEFVDDQAYALLHLNLAKYFWAEEFSLKISPSVVPILKELIGLDLMVQYMPYLRVARPNRASDNVGFHKDTQYGQTPYEITVHLPFVDLNEGAALKVISRSHLEPESNYPSNVVDTGVEKGSDEHNLGKPYASKRLKVPKKRKTNSLNLKLGQAAIFVPSIFHGQEINLGPVTRVSTDLRFVNTNASVNLKIGKTRAGYVPVSSSPVEQVAKSYYTANPQIS